MKTTYYTAVQILSIKPEMHISKHLKRKFDVYKTKS